MVLFFFSLPVLIGITGMVIDLTNLYTRRAYAQRAADSAALAGALVSSPTASDAFIIQESKKYGALNGYSKDDQITVVPRVGGVVGKVQVTVARPETVFFMPLMEFLLGNDPKKARIVGATAVAQKFGNARLALGGNYGTTTGASNPSAFGPFAKHSYGDPYSVYFHNDGTLNDADSEHLKKNNGVGWDSTSHYNPEGFTYTMTVSSNFADNNNFLRVELYDPDGFDSKDGDSLDEIHNDYINQEYEGKTRGASEATTQYSIEKRQSDGAFKEIVKPISYGGTDSSVDAATLKAKGENPWVTPEGFRLSMAEYGAGEYRIRVKTTDGSSENGYNLRAGPDYEQPAVQTRTKEEWAALENKWNQDYGDKGGTDPSNIKVPILSDGNLQMNFTRTAPVKVRLGEVPATAAGQDVTITKFDTDVGTNSKDIHYFFVSKDGKTTSDATETTSLDTRDDYWSQNTIKVPDGFGDGYLFAQYNAGQNDTSSWSMAIPGIGESVKLIQ